MCTVQERRYSQVPLIKEIMYSIEAEQKQTKELMEGLDYGNEIREVKAGLEKISDCKYCIL